MKTLSIVIPVCDEKDNLELLRNSLNKVLSSETLKGIKVEILINDNNSRDGSVEYLNAWANEDDKVRFFPLKNNIGFQNSILYGMNNATGDALIVLQSDLQDPPEIIEIFVKYWLDGARVVGGIIRNRNENFFSKNIRRIFYWFLGASSDESIVISFQDFYLLDRSVYEIIKRTKPFHAFIRARISSEFGIDAIVPYDRNPRLNGISKFNFAAKYKLALDALLMYGSRFVRLLSLISFASSVLLFIGNISLFLLHFTGVKYLVQGWLSLISILLFGFSLILLLISIIIEYLFRIYRILSLS